MPKKLVYNHGINDSEDYIVKQEKIDNKWKVVWRCPIYTMWRNILERCYSEKFHIKHPTYRGCTIHDEWLYFSNFKAWVLTQNYEGRDIDKDLLFENNKHYSPETCIFVPHEINVFILKSEGNRGDFAIGVSYRPERNKNPFYSHISGQGKRKNHLGCFDNEYNAHLAWQKKKIEYCDKHILKYEHDSNTKRVLEKYKKSILNDINNSRFTV